MNTPAPESNPASYVAAVLILYVDLPETPLRASVQDQWQARRLRDRGVPLPVVEAALLLASLRRLLRPADVPPLPPIRSLAYSRLTATSTTSGSRSAASPARNPSRRTFRKIRF
jgi:hypothetical protein